MTHLSNFIVIIAINQLRTEYSYFLRHHHFIDTLLKSLFHLMPENPVIELPSSTNRQSGSLGLSATSNMFSDASAFNILGKKLQSLTNYCIYSGDKYFNFDV